MNQAFKKVTPLKKIYVRITAGDNAEPAAFIYGIGQEGLSPFEIALADKKIGDAVPLDGKSDETVFGHLWPIFQNQVSVYPAAELSVEIIDIAESSPREVVSAISELVSGCDCGCGCGGGHGDAHGLTSSRDDAHRRHHLPKAAGKFSAFSGVVEER